jgi:hypothetical protein
MHTPDQHTYIASTIRNNSMLHPQLAAALYASNNYKSCHTFACSSTLHKQTDALTHKQHAAACADPHWLVI